MSYLMTEYFSTCVIYFNFKKLYSKKKSRAEMRRGAGFLATSSELLDSFICLRLNFQQLGGGVGKEANSVTKCPSGLKQKPQPPPGKLVHVKQPGEDILRWGGLLPAICQRGS